jgi:hypothetical protein
MGPTVSRFFIVFYFLFTVFFILFCSLHFPFLHKTACLNQTPGEVEGTAYLLVDEDLWWDRELEAREWWRLIFR